MTIVELCIGMLQYLDNLKGNFKEFIVYYIDVDFTLWLTWLLTPLIISFLLPMVILCLLYLSILLLYIFKLHWHMLRRTYDSADKWNLARKVLAAIWDGHSWIWHGYEVRGMEHIPDEGPALLIYYHGAIPIDIYYLLAKVVLHKNRIINTVADYFFFKVPGFSILTEGMHVVPGTIQTCSNILKEGNLLAIAPGGVYESQFSIQYNLMWKKRKGFAKVALEAKVPIIPIFTENLRESFRTVSIGQRLFLKLYSLTKFPFTPVYGGFPVKLITHIGKPIPYDSSLTAEELQVKVSQALNQMIDENQRKPGNILHGLLDRIPFLAERHKKRE